MRESLTVSFLGIGSLVFFLKLSMVLGVHVYLCVTEPVFLEKIPIGQKWSKMARKHGFWSFEENHVIIFVWNLCEMKVLLVH